MKFDVCTAITLEGLESVLAQELQAQGAKDVTTTKRAVQFSANKEVLYKTNLRCQTALRILKMIRACHIRDEDDLYYELNKIEWDQYFDVDKTISIRSVLVKHHFKNDMFFTLKAKDGIVDYFSKKMQRRPNIDRINPDVVIHLFLIKNKLRIFLDSSGKSLHKRGYRVESGPAALNEVLAAGIIKLAKPKPGEKIILPMCGSGTFGFESLFHLKGRLKAKERAYCFQNWLDYEPDLYDSISHIRDVEIEKFECTDVSLGSLSAFRHNLDHSQLHDYFNLSRKDFFKMDGQEGALLLLNPPYDERMALTDAVAFYKKIGDTLKKKWTGSRAAVISSSVEGMKHFGLRPSLKVKMFNSQIPAELRIFNMF